MEINLQFIIDIAPIVLLIIIIVQLKEFRDTWWRENVAETVNRTKFQNESMGQSDCAREFQNLNRRLDRRQK